MLDDAKRIGMRLALFGLALIVQGCWEKQEDEFTYLGEGGCRTVANDYGTFKTIAEPSLGECQAQCFNGNGPCTAIEYIPETGNCEIHSQPITHFESKAGAHCYVPKS